jgi:lysine 6-dehydrogenase
MKSEFTESFMKVLIVGCGNIGSVAAEDIAKSMQSSISVVVADQDEKKAEVVARKVSTKNTSSAKLDVNDHDYLVKYLREFDVILGFLPGILGYRLMQACIEAQRNLVDVSYMAENPLVLNEKAVKARVTIVPDCGLAPGISNLLVGHAVESLDKVKLVGMMVGGLPEKPFPPLEYTITWSPESLIDEYTRKARIIRQGKITEVEALTGIELVDFPGVGKLEAFFTDGLRTLMYTVMADEMWEKTLRYPGHANKIELLSSLGFFDEKQIKINGADISPRRLTAKLLERILAKPNVDDFVALRVEVEGIKNNSKKSFEFIMLDQCDKNRYVTSMARTTAYPASIAAQLLLKGKIDEHGIIPPEKLGMDKDLFKTFLGELESRNIRITEKESSL